jgi:DNA-binding CsgD family transcriptional regulator
MKNNFGKSKIKYSCGDQSVVAPVVLEQTIVDLEQKIEHEDNPILNQNNVHIIANYLYKLFFFPKEAYNMLLAINSWFNSDEILLSISHRKSNEQLLSLRIDTNSDTDFCTSNDENMLDSKKQFISCFAYNENLRGTLILKSDNFSNLQKLELKELEVHFRRCINYFSISKNLSASTNSATSLIDLIDEPIAIINDKGKICAINPCARKLFKLGEKESLNFDIFWREALEIANIEGSYNYAFNYGSNKFNAILSFFEQINGSLMERGAFVKFELIPNQKPNFIEMFSNTYKLTKAESLVLELLYNKRSMAQIASDRNSSIETVKSHLRTIRSKTWTKNRLELIALLNDMRRNND